MKAHPRHGCGLLAFGRTGSRTAALTRTPNMGRLLDPSADAQIRQF
jgi:hypothetical protein